MVVWLWLPKLSMYKFLEPMNMLSHVEKKDFEDMVILQIWG